MFLPLGMIRNLQMPILRKLSLAVLFGLGVLVIITATIRVVQIGQIEGVRPSLVWLVTWSTIESSVDRSLPFRLYSLSLSDDTTMIRPDIRQFANGAQLSL